MGSKMLFAAAAGSKEGLSKKAETRMAADQPPFELSKLSPEWR